MVILELGVPAILIIGDATTGRQIWGLLWLHREICTDIHIYR